MPPIALFPSCTIQWYYSLTKVFLHLLLYPTSFKLHRFIYISLLRLISDQQRFLQKHLSTNFIDNQLLLINILECISTLHSFTFCNIFLIYIIDSRMNIHISLRKPLVFTPFIFRNLDFGRCLQINLFSSLFGHIRRNFTGL